MDVRKILSWQGLLVSQLGFSDKEAMNLCDWITDGIWPENFEDYWPKVSFDALPELYYLAKECWWHHASRWELISAQVSELPNTFSTNASTENPVLIQINLERHFNLAQSFLSQGLVDASLTHLDQLLRRSQHHPILLQLFSQKVAIEKGAIALNYGETLKSKAFLEFILDNESYKQQLDFLGSIMTSRATACLTLNYIQSGDFKKAHQALEQCKLHTLSKDTDEVPPGLRRLSVRLALAQENYELASKLITKSVSSLNEKSKTWCLFQHQKLRLLLLQNKLNEAQTLLLSLSRITKEICLSQQILDLNQETFEIALRAGLASEALLAEIEKAVRLALDGKNKSVYASLQIMQAACLTKLNKPTEATVLIQSALSIATENGLKLIELDALFHGAGAAFSGGQLKLLGEYLRQGEALARECKLQNRKVIFSYLRSVTVRNQTRCLALFEVLGSLQLHNEVSFLIDFYGIASATQIKTLDNNGFADRKLWSDAEFREYVRNHPGIYFFPEEGSVIVNNGHDVRGIQKNADEFFGKALLAFLEKGQKGLSIFDIHYLKSNVPYKSQYEGAVRIAVHRLKQDFKSLGLELHTEAMGQKTYKLQTVLPFGSFCVE